VPDGWWQFATVAVTAMSPVGELLVAVPAGLALGLPAVPVIAVASLSNLAPAAGILWLLRRAERRPMVERWLQWLRRDAVVRAANRYGTAGVVLLTPLLGVYAVTATMGLLGMHPARLATCIAGSIALYAALLGLAIHLGKAIPL
jgi:hypothetical protein